MSRYWIRRPSRVKETLGAGLLAVGVATATFYFVRLMLARELLPEPSPSRESEKSETGGEEE